MHSLGHSFIIDNNHHSANRRRLRVSGTTENSLLSATAVPETRRISVNVELLIELKQRVERGEFLGGVETVAAFQLGDSARKATRSPFKLPFQPRPFSKVPETFFPRKSLSLCVEELWFFRRAKPARACCYIDSTAKAAGL